MIASNSKARVRFVRENPYFFDYLRVDLKRFHKLFQNWRAPSFANDYEDRALLVSYGVVQAPLFLRIHVSCGPLDADRGGESLEIICHRPG